MQGEGRKVGATLVVARLLLLIWAGARPSLVYRTMGCSPLFYRDAQPYVFKKGRREACPYELPSSLEFVHCVV